jgi:hypothetical protein
LALSTHASACTSIVGDPHNSRWTKRGTLVVVEVQVDLGSACTRVRTRSCVERPDGVDDREAEEHGDVQRGQQVLSFHL